MASFQRCRTIAFLFIALFLVPSPVLSQDRITVVTTTTDLRSLAEAVGRDRVSVVSLVPANLDAEEYQPKPQDLVLLKNARLVVRIGLDYDLWLNRLLTQSGNAALRRDGYIDASVGIATLEVRGKSVGPGDGHAHGSGNPHYWLDPKNGEIITATILAGLVRIDPDNAALYQANQTAFVQKLQAKLTEWETMAAPLRGVPIVAYHNSWPYFARRFRIEILDIVESKPGVPPAPSHLAAIVQKMKSRGAKIVIREPHEPQRDAAFVADKVNGSVVTLAGSVGALPRADDYLALFDRNLEALLAGIKR